MNQNEEIEQQTSQGPTGEASSGESDVQSAAVIFEILEAIQSRALGEYRDANRISWLRFWKKGDAIVRALAWNQAWRIVLEKIEKHLLSTKRNA
jgi:hypothetical protein